MQILTKWGSILTLCVLIFNLSSTNLLAFHEKTAPEIDTRTQKLRTDQNVGCGPGNYIMKDSTVFSLTMRGTTNNSFSAQLFGVSSGTCGCRKHEVVQGAENKRQLFWPLINKTSKWSWQRPELNVLTTWPIRPSSRTLIKKVVPNETTSDFFWWRIRWARDACSYLDQRATKKKS